MKNLINRLALIVAFIGAMTFGVKTVAEAKNAETKTVTFYVHLHCQECINKIMQNIAFEKGVKDIKCDLNSKTVVVTYVENKTDIPTLQKAFKKINKPAFLTMDEYKLYHHEH